MEGRDTDHHPVYLGHPHHIPVGSHRRRSETWGNRNPIYLSSLLPQGLERLLWAFLSVVQKTKGKDMRVVVSFDISTPCSSTAKEIAELFCKLENGGYILNGCDLTDFRCEGMYDNIIDPDQTYPG